MAALIKFVAAACLLVCISVFNVDVVDGGKCPYIPFCDDCTYNSDTKRATCTRCEPSNLHGLTTVNGFSRCGNCSENAGCFKCKTFERCEMCRSIQDGPDLDAGVATCSACAENCRRCGKSGSGKCDDCKAGFRKVGAVCESCEVPKCKFCDGSRSRCSACMAGLYLEDNQCKPCVANCKTCNNPQTCSICDDFYFLETDTKTCKSCPDNCKTCSDIGNCRICKIGYYLDSDKKCSPCGDNCLVCKSAPGQCEHCIKGRPVNGYCGCAANCQSCESEGWGKCDSNSCINGYEHSQGKGCQKKVENKEQN